MVCVSWEEEEGGGLHLIMSSFSLNGTYHIGSFSTRSKGSKVNVWLVLLLYAMVTNASIPEKGCILSDNN